MEGSWIIQFGNTKNANSYYIITELPQNKESKLLGAFVKYNQKGFIEEIIPTVQEESMGTYQYKYDNKGILIEAFYYPKVALDEEKVQLRSIIEYSENQLVIKYLNPDQSIKYIEKYYN